ncbi:MAG: 16S rRNA (guanine(966)-N(2))-methyltransferase RsmD [Bacillus thermozeamaize]|uniref:16S rRNA (Guanine(966)-N(2))-methyltransferase RsmD n=1 Tax=Bacillus thermozeamaize TaxID=230954 RepID=A0A1Y3PLU3_9BACI|nr:MAG: 16S rRNA (guanine(966)-N(2))-methyltransferase RsmD [Bacillus thermozeamaize]
MRVIAGEFRGRNLKSVPGRHVRPTSDKVKGAMFNMIGPFFEGGRGLDLFAGTGALGIEALSRGLEQVVFVDHSRQSIRVIQTNLRMLGLEGQAEVYQMGAEEAVSFLAERNRRFDLVFLDPPYMSTRESLAPAWLTQLAQGRLLAQAAKVVLEHDARVSFPDRLGVLEKVKERRYGNTTLTIFEHT